EPVGGVLSQAQHPGGLHGLLLGGSRERCFGRRHGRRLDGLGFGDRNRLSGLSRDGWADTGAASGGQLPVELLDPLAQIGVLFYEPRQLVLHQVEEGVDLVLVVTALADWRLTERHIVYVGWCKRHCSFPSSSCQT